MKKNDPELARDLGIEQKHTLTWPIGHKTYHPMFDNSADKDQPLFWAIDQNHKLAQQYAAENGITFPEAINLMLVVEMQRTRTMVSQIKADLDSVKTDVSYMETNVTNIESNTSN